MSNDDLGVIYELEGIHDEPLSYSELDRYFHQIRKAFSTLVPGVPSFNNLGNVVIQIIAQNRRLIEPLEKDRPKNNKLASQILRAEEKVIHENFTFCDRKFYLTIRYKLLFST